MKVKPVEAYRIVGHSVARRDIPAKATGSFVSVHDVRLPGMLHGRLVRPPMPASTTAVSWAEA